MKLDFVGIGARKAGTTWVSECLQEHPQINFSKNKETNHFLSDEFLEEMKKDPVLGDPVRFIRVLDLATQFDTSSKVRGEFSPYYLYDEFSPKKIFENNSDMKLIVCLRNPIEAIYSNYWFDKSTGIRNIPNTFEQYIEKYSYLIHWFKYYEQLQKYTKIFSKSQMHFILFDEIKADPKKVIKQLYEFLDLDSTFSPLTLQKKSNSSKKVRLQLLADIGRILAVVLINLRLRKVIDGLYMIYEKINKSDFKYPEINEKTKFELKKFYEDDIFALQKLVKKDLSNWTK